MSPLLFKVKDLWEVGSRLLNTDLAVTGEAPVTMYMHPSVRSGHLRDGHLVTQRSQKPGGGVGNNNVCCIQWNFYTGSTHRCHIRMRCAT